MLKLYGGRQETGGTTKEEMERESGGVELKRGGRGRRGRGRGGGAVRGRGGLVSRETGETGETGERGGEGGGERSEVISVAELT